MRFLLDQDVYAVTGKFLADGGHDVLLVAPVDKILGILTSIIQSHNGLGKG